MNDAPRRRRRVLGLAVLLPMVLTGCGLLALACRARPPLPLAEVERARSALRQARVEAAGRAAPQLQRAEAAAERLEQRLAEERASRLRPPRSAEIARLAGEVEAAALAARRELRRDALRLRAGRAARRAALSVRLDELAAALEHAPADRALRARHQSARLDLAASEEADRTSRPGDSDAGEAGLQAAVAEVAGLEELIDRRTARLHDPIERARWQAWVDATAGEGGTAVVVDKLRRRCVLLRDGRVAASFPAELGRNGLADKLYAGDGATPEGRYRIVAKKDLGATRYHRALLLDYPTAADLRELRAARRRGLVPAGRGAGGLIEIHGRGGRGLNWTNGCVALRNAQMDRLFAAVEVGTPVTIVGTARLPPGGGR